MNCTGSNLRKHVRGYRQWDMTLSSIARNTYNSTLPPLFPSFWTPDWFSQLLIALWNISLCAYNGYYTRNKSVSHGEQMNEWFDLVTCHATASISASSFGRQEEVGKRGMLHVKRVRDEPHFFSRTWLHPQKLTPLASPNTHNPSLGSIHGSPKFLALTPCLTRSSQQMPPPTRIHHHHHRTSLSYFTH